jgi:membrane-associated protease RseP (regulator of RpoE activity)
LIDTNLLIGLIISIFFLRWIVIYHLDKRGTLEKYNISTIGPILMIRTLKGQKFLERIARPKKFWRAFASFGIPIVFISMVSMFALVLYADVHMLTSPPPPPGPLSSPLNMLLIPGLNQFIPLVWGLIGLIATLVVHEFSHAILAKVERIKVKSLALLTVILPIGAGTEIDEDELFGPEEKSSKTEKVATSEERVRILSAGVASNFFIAFVAFALFFGPVMGSIAPQGEGVPIYGVIEGYPAGDSGITERSIILKIDDQRTKTLDDFYGAMDKRSPGDKIRIRTNSGEYNVILAENPDDVTRGYLGISLGYSTGESLNTIKSVPSSLTSVKGWLTLYGLPIIFGGFIGNLNSFYSPVGAASFLGDGFFWIANALFWIAWINFIAGLFNCLPATPLDGGYIFKEALSKIFGRFTRDEKRITEASNTVGNIFGLMIFSSILFTVIWQCMGYL